MRLYNKTTSVRDIWEEDKDGTNSSTNKSTAMYESAFYNPPKIESGKKTAFSSLKAKLKISPSFSKLMSDKKSTKQASTSQNVKRDAPLVNDCNQVGLNSNFEHSEKSKLCIAPTSKPNLYRGKSDACLSRNIRKDSKYCVGINCRTEFTIPGEYLFCSKVEHTNNFESVYNQIRSGNKLRRSRSTGSIGKLPKSHKTRSETRGEFDTTGVMKRKSVHIKDAGDVDSGEVKGGINHSDSMRTTCEKLYSHKCDAEKQPRKPESKLLAEELQSILDSHGKSVNVRKANSFSLRRRHEKETSFTEKVKNDEKHLGDVVVVPNAPEEVATKSRSRRSHSCKSIQRRLSNLFSISKYVKDRHTQRSKSFATIREFSNHDASYRKNRSRNAKRNESIGYYDNTLVIAEQKRNFSKETDRTPTKTPKIFDINHTDARGNSCLHHASSKGDVSTIKYLLAQGGDVWVKNDEHSLPIDLAQNFQTAKLLSSATLFYSEQNEPRKDKNIVQTAKLNTAL